MSLLSLYCQRFPDITNVFRTGFRLPTSSFFQSSLRPDCFVHPFRFVPCSSLRFRHSAASPFQHAISRHLRSFAFRPSSLSLRLFILFILSSLTTSPSSSSHTFFSSSLHHFPHLFTTFFLLHLLFLHSSLFPSPPPPHLSAPPGRRDLWNVRTMPRHRSQTRNAALKSPEYANIAIFYYICIRIHTKETCASNRRNSSAG